jgi:hypothetical protein
MTPELGVAIAVAVISSGVWPILLPKLMERRHIARMKEIEDRDRDRDTWFRESKEAYNRVKDECSACEKQLDRMRNGFYGLLEDLEDQIIPMLLLPDPDQDQIRIAVRACARRARTAVAVPLRLTEEMPQRLPSELPPLPEELGR